MFHRWSPPQYANAQAVEPAAAPLPRGSPWLLVRHNFSRPVSPRALCTIGIDRATVLGGVGLLAFLLVVWYQTGVSILDSAWYLTYQCLWVFVPGVILYCSLCGPARSTLEVVCKGMAIGVSGVILGFPLYAVLGMPWLNTVQPFLILAAGLLILRLRRAGPIVLRWQRNSNSLAVLVFVTIICASILVLAAGSFT